ncbi:MAG: argininosuccinate synthase, partial [Microbacterium sp.]|nr:argininosuccinate synthase [Microbacterium sp.]
QSLMLRESIQKWVGSTITGSVTVRLRRGEDYTILDTVASGMSYSPEKLSMERVGDAAFGPVDRIGQLTMRNLDIADSRARLEQYAAMGLLGGPTGELVGDVAAGGAHEITESASPLDAAGERLAEATDAAGEAAAFDAGTD